MNEDSGNEDGKSEWVWYLYKNMSRNRTQGT